AVQIGNYGYGIGDQATVGFEEVILGEFAQQLGGSNSIGHSLLQAEEDYFASMPSFTPYDLKVVQEIATWGMPMYKLNGGTPSGGFGNGTFTSVNPGIPGVTGLQTQVTSSFNQHTTND